MFAPYAAAPNHTKLIEVVVESRFSAMPNSGPEMLSDLALVAQRFAMQEFAVRRLHASNAEFRATCEDLAAAIRAAEFWSADASRAGDYRVLVKELESEIVDALAGARQTSVERQR